MRLSEIYESVQGEGPRVGTPTIFVRFAGCNLRCPGWPCDTQHAIDPAKYRKEWQLLDPHEVYERIKKLPHYDRIRNICWTGGEPFLQSEVELHDLYWALKEDGKDLECFSNGTLRYPRWATRGDTFAPVRFVMDWKLPGSGEVLGNRRSKNYYLAPPLSDKEPVAIMAKNLFDLIECGATQSVKFTVANREDFEIAYDVWDFYFPHRDSPQVFVGAVWGKLETSELVTWLLEKNVPWKLNVQVHNYIWNREQRGI